MRSAGVLKRVVIGWDNITRRPELRIPRSTEAIWILTMGVAGLLRAGGAADAAGCIGYPVAMGTGNQGVSCGDILICQNAGAVVVGEMQIPLVTSPSVSSPFLTECGR